MHKNIILSTFAEEMDLQKSQQKMNNSPAYFASCRYVVPTLPTERLSTPCVYSRTYKLAYCRSPLVTSSHLQPHLVNSCRL